MRNKYKRSAFFDMSDDLFYRISLLGFLVVFSSMVFFLTKYIEKGKSYLKSNGFFRSKSNLFEDIQKFIYKR